MGTFERSRRVSLSHHLSAEYLRIRQLVTATTHTNSAETYDVLNWNAIAALVGVFLTIQDLIKIQEC